MSEVIELDSVDVLSAGAIGQPGQRAFYIQAAKEDARLTVLVEKEQVALLASEALAFLDRVAQQHPEPDDEVPPRIADVGLREPAVPLFRAQAIGIGFDPERQMVVLELREHGDDDSEHTDEGWVARLFATRGQVRTMAAAGKVAVTSGRPPCPLCDQPMDPGGHVCPRWN